MVVKKGHSTGVSSCLHGYTGKERTVYRRSLLHTRLYWYGNDSLQAFCPHGYTGKERTVYRRPAHKAILVRKGQSTGAASFCLQGYTGKERPVYRPTAYQAILVRKGQSTGVLPQGHTGKERAVYWRSLLLPTRLYW